MKGKFASFVLLAVIGLLVSCVSAGKIYQPLTESEASRYTIIGTVQAPFETGNISGANAVVNQAYVMLRAEASKKYQGEVDIRNIRLVWQDDLIGAEYMAIGDVVAPKEDI
jgi:hypothetical protein